MDNPEIPFLSWFETKDPTEFDRIRLRFYPLDVNDRIRRTLQVSPQLIEAAKQRGMSLSDYIMVLHMNQRSNRVAYVSSIYRSFALLEMSRVPLDPAYYQLVDGVLGEEEGRVFRAKAGSGEALALPRAAARLLGADTRVVPVEAILLASHGANLLHEGFLEAARLLEATFYR
jgi:hypothetical protein